MQRLEAAAAAVEDGEGETGAGGDARHYPQQSSHLSLNNQHYHSAGGSAADFASAGLSLGFAASVDTSNASGSGGSSAAGSSYLHSGGSARVATGSRAGRARTLLFCVKCLVPELASGALLGRGGRTIQELTACTGSTIKLSPASYARSPVALMASERVVSVMGGREGVLAACAAVFDIIAAEVWK